MKPASEPAGNIDHHLEYFLLLFLVLLNLIVFVYLKRKDRDTDETVTKWSYLFLLNINILFFTTSVIRESLQTFKNLFDCLTTSKLHTRLKTKTDKG